MVRDNGKFSRSGLAIELSAIKGFSKPKVSVEQYMTDPEIAATVLWDAYMKGDIKGKRVADLGCGNGMLGIGAMLLGASKVYFVESDSLVIEIAKENVKNMKSGGLSEFFLMDVGEFDKKVDTVIMNPPFGVKSEHSDRKFLEKAFSIGDVVYSFHKNETKDFVERFAKDNSFDVGQVIDFEFPLKATMRFHRKRVKKIRVSCFRLVRKNY